MDRNDTREKILKTIENLKDMVEKDSFSGIVCVFTKKGNNMTNMITHELGTQTTDLFVVKWNIEKLIDTKLSAQSAAIVE